MLTAQILSKNQKNLAAPMAQYWLKRWAKNRKKLYIPLIFDRFLYLNTIHFHKYYQKTLSLWYYLAPKQDPWKIVIPPKEKYAIISAKYLFSKNIISPLNMFLSKISSKKYIAQRYKLEGDIFLKRGLVQKAFIAYKKAINKHENPKVIFSIIDTLLKNKYIDQLYSLLAKEKRFFFFTFTNRLFDIIMQKKYFHPFLSF